MFWQWKDEEAKRLADSQVAYFVARIRSQFSFEIIDDHRVLTNTLIGNLRHPAYMERVAKRAKAVFASDC